jgi:hypothetical protein
MKRKTAKLLRERRRAVPCRNCGKPSEFFIITDGREPFALMAVESIGWRCLDCLLKYYSTEGLHGLGPHCIAHRA